MIRGAILANLVLYTLVASQPIAYLLFLGAAQRALAGPAWVELRQRIDPVMTRRLPVLYLLTLAAGALVVVLAWRARSFGDLLAASAGLLALVVDVFFMLRENVPINGVVDRWRTSELPADWEDYRTRWFSIFGVRQRVLLAGFFCVLLGAVYR